MIEKDIEIARSRGTALGNYQYDDIEECRRHIELIVDLCRDIKDTCHADVRKVFAKSAGKLEEDLTFIRKNELRINSNNAEAIAHLNKITLIKKNLALELRTLIERVKTLDYENKDLQNKINTLDVSYHQNDTFLPLYFCSINMRRSLQT